jgi:hypothetical protein
MDRIAAIVCGACLALLFGSTAYAQIGAPVSTVAFEINGAAIIEPEGRGGELEDAIHQFGITLLVSHSPGGPLIASVSQTPPFPRANPESPEEIGFAFPGAPPGSYWVLLVVGVTTTTSAPPSAWVPLVIPPRCTGRPGPPSIIGSIDGSTVTLATGGGAGCTWDRIDFEVGFTPGSTSFTIPAPVGPLVVPNVPPGLYYVRARARNAFGASAPSLEIPITVPGGCQPGPEAPIGFTVSVGPGNNVTASWSQNVTTGITFYQLYLIDSQTLAVNSFLLPPSLRSASAPLPSGTYELGIMSGGPCGLTYPFPGSITFTVP